MQTRLDEWNAPWPELPDFMWQNFAEKFPVLDFNLPFEEGFFINDYTPTVRALWSNVMIISVLYIVAVFGGIKLMKNRPAFDLIWPLRFWNLFLAVFSLWGAFRTVPFTLYTYFAIGEAPFICASGSTTYNKNAFGLAVCLFVYSKIFELIDTLFLVLRKKPVNFLHWFHHCTVLAYTWDAYANHQNSGSLFISMNYTVHAVMYTYYFLAACNKPPAWGKFVTVIQITQMVFGSYWSFRALQFTHAYGTMSEVPAEALTMDTFTEDVIRQHGCHMTKPNCYAAVLMYMTYLYLFSEFFVKRYILRSNKTKTPKKVE